jgi:hypothetical protein
VITQWPILIRSLEGDGWFCEGVPAKRTSVVQVPEDALDQFRNPKTRKVVESTYGRVSADASRQLVDLSQIASATHKRALRRLAKLAWEAAPLPEKGTQLPAVIVPEAESAALESATPRYKAATLAVRSPLDSLGALLNAALLTSGITPVLWQRELYRESFFESQLMPALLCPNCTQALFVHALFRISYKWGLRVCAHCKLLFSVSASATQSVECCSRRCSLAENQRRYRTRKKLKQKRGGLCAR